MSSVNQEVINRTRAGEYVLGTMNDNDLRDFELALRHSAQLQAGVRDWHEILQPLSNTVTPVDPPANIWSAIASEVASTEQFLPPPKPRDAATEPPDFDDDDPINTPAPRESRKPSDSIAYADLDRDIGNIVETPDQTAPENAALVASAELAAQQQSLQKPNGKLAFWRSTTVLAALAALALGAVQFKNYLPNLSSIPLMRYFPSLVNPSRTAVHDAISLLNTADGQTHWVATIDRTGDVVQVSAIKPAAASAGSVYTLWLVTDAELGGTPVRLGELADNAMEMSVLSLQKSLGASGLNASFAISLESTTEYDVPESPTAPILYQAAINSLSN